MKVKSLSHVRLSRPHGLQPTKLMSAVNLTCCSAPSVCVCVCVCVRAGARSVFGTSWTIARQASLSMGFSRQEYWSGLPFLPPGDLPQPRGRTCVSCIFLHWQSDSLPLSHLGSPMLLSHKKHCQVHSSHSTNVTKSYVINYV